MKRQYTRSETGNLTAKYLLEIGAVEFRPDQPFRFTSGRYSPVYVDIRRILGHPAARDFRVVAGGETAGIPIAALIADRMDKPMAYVRKKPKGFGRDAQIEGLSEAEIAKGQRFLLCEDLMSEGGSKQNFIDAIRRSGNIVAGCFSIYSYGCFGAEDRLLKQGVPSCSIVTAKLLADVAEDLGIYDTGTIAGVRAFVANPDAYMPTAEPESPAVDPTSHQPESADKPAPDL
jgi:orotate phosphoribosyltransferase